jgi:hypothetical protein
MSSWDDSGFNPQKQQYSLRIASNAEHMVRFISNPVSRYLNQTLFASAAMFHHGLITLKAASIPFG